MRQATIDAISQFIDACYDARPPNTYNLQGVPAYVAWKEALATFCPPVQPHAYSSEDNAAAAIAAGVSEDQILALLALLIESMRSS